MDRSTLYKRLLTQSSSIVLVTQTAAMMAGLLLAVSCRLFEPPAAPRLPHPQVAVYTCQGEHCRPLELDMGSVFAETEGQGYVMPVAFSRDGDGEPGFAQVTVAQVNAGCSRVVIVLPDIIEFVCAPKPQRLQVCTTLPAGEYRIRYLPERGTLEVAPGDSGQEAWGRGQTLLEIYLDDRHTAKKLFKQNAASMTSYVPLKVVGTPDPYAMCSITVTLVKGKLRAGSPLSKQDAAELAGIALAGADAVERDDIEHWLAWTEFARANRRAWRSKEPLSEKEMRALLDAYRASTGVPSTTLPTTEQALRQRLAAWERLPTAEKALWSEYIQRYGDTADVTVGEDLRITDDVKLGMALRIAPNYLRPGAREALIVLVNDPLFQMTAVAAMTLYFAAWLAPEPFFSKGIVVIATIGIISTCGATVAEIVTLARAWMQLRDKAAQAKTLAELERAAEGFGRALGGSGMRLLLAVATVIAGKLLPRPSVVTPNTPAGAVPVAQGPQGAAVVALQVRVVDSIATLVAVPLAMAAARGGGGSGASGSGSGLGTAKPGTAGFKPFTAANFRENLARLTGGVPKGAEAHHVFPQKFAKQFEKAGINIHDPRYGAWWQSPAHQNRARAYNDEWAQFLFRGKPKTLEDILQFGRDLARDYGFQIFF